MLSSPSKRQSIGRLLLEAALIVLGVLLGLTLNQWRETRNDDQRKLDRLSENFYVASNMDPSHLMGLATALFILTNDILIQERRLTKRYPEMLENLANTNP